MGGGRKRGSKKVLKEIPLNLTFLNFNPKNEIAFKFTRKSLLNAARARLAQGFIKEIPFKIQHVQDERGCEFTSEILLKFFPQLQFSKENPLKISSILFFSQGNLL